MRSPAVSNWIHVQKILSGRISYAPSLTTDRANVAGEHEIEFHWFTHFVAGRRVHDRVFFAELAKLGPTVFVKLAKARQSRPRYTRARIYPIQDRLVFVFDVDIEGGLLVFLFASVRGSIRIASNSITF